MQNKTIRFKKIISRVLLYFCFIFMVSIIFFPFYWILISSFKTQSEIYMSPPTIFPQIFTVSNYVTAFVESDCFRYLLNSVFVSGMSTLVTSVVCVFAAYSLTRLEYKGKEIFLGLLASTQVFPLVVTIVPLYMLYQKINLYNTYTSLILTYSAICIPIAITLLLGYFNDLPKELEEAAKLDGCSRLQVLSKILFPIVKPGIAATAIYIFLNNWQEYLIAVSLIADKAKYTLTIGLSTFQLEHSVNWGALMAVSIVIATPAIIMFFFIEKYFVDSLAGAVKE